MSSKKKKAESIDSSIKILVDFDNPIMKLTRGSPPAARAVLQPIQEWIPL